MSDSPLLLRLRKASRRKKPNINVNLTVLQK